MLDVGYGTMEGPSGGAGGARADVEQAGSPRLRDRSKTAAGIGEDRVGGEDGAKTVPVSRFQDRAKTVWEATTRKARQVGDAVLGDGPKEPEWHANGTVVGLLIDVGGTSGYYMFLILTMFFGLEANKNQLLSCAVGPGELEFRTWPQACLCAYTKSHLLVFPTLSLSVVLIYMGRDLLQKRLYYGLLRNGGVMDFHQNKPFKDALVLLLMVNYLHVVGHLILMYWIVYTREGESWKPHWTHGFFRHEVDTIRRRLSVENAKLHVLGFLWGAVMIPGTLVIAFVFLGYDIEKTLVPLSQYVHGLEDSREAHEKLNSLSVFRDVCVKTVVEDPSGPVAAARGSDPDTQYRAVVEAASRAPRELEDEHPSLGLYQALWPAALLLRRSTPHRDARIFRWVWRGTAGGAISLMVFALMTLGPLLVKDLRRATEAGHHQVFAQVPMLACGLAAVSVIVKEFARTFWLQGRPACEAGEVPLTVTGDSDS